MKELRQQFATRSSSEAGEILAQMATALRAASRAEAAAALITLLDNGTDEPLRNVSATVSHNLPMTSSTPSPPQAARLDQGAFFCVREWRASQNLRAGNSSWPQLRPAWGSQHHLRYAEDIRSTASPIAAGSCSSIPCSLTGPAATRRLTVCQPEDCLDPCPREEDFTPLRNPTEPAKREASR